MATLDTYAQVDAELAATVNFDNNASVSEAKRRVAALRRKLDFAEQTDENGRRIVFNHSIVNEQIEQAKAFVQQNQTVTEAEAEKHPSVIHADFSGFGQYR